MEVYIIIGYKFGIVVGKKASIVLIFYLVPIVSISTSTSYTEINMGKFFATL